MGNLQMILSASALLSILLLLSAKPQGQYNSMEPLRMLVPKTLTLDFSRDDKLNIYTLYYNSLNPVNCNDLTLKGNRSGITTLVAR
jgi:hypothetical protein